jgi:hypothetical protein
MGLSRMELDLLLALVIAILDLLPMPGNRWTFDVGALGVFSHDTSPIG